MNTEFRHHKWKVCARKRCHSMVEFQYKASPNRKTFTERYIDTDREREREQARRISSNSKCAHEILLCLQNVMRIEEKKIHHWIALEVIICFFFPCSFVCANRFVSSFFLCSNSPLVHSVFFFSSFISYSWFQPFAPLCTVHVSCSLLLLFFGSISFVAIVVYSVLCCIWYLFALFLPLSLSLSHANTTIPLYSHIVIIYLIFIVFQYSFSCESNVLTVSHRQVICTLLYLFSCVFIFFRLYIHIIA